MMEGFFVIPSGGSTKAARTVLTTCPCGLQATCSGPMMAVGGRGRKGVMVLAEAPGAQEDAAYAEELRTAKAEGREPVGTQLIGAAGQRLVKELLRHDINLYEDCWLLNAVNCRPPKNRTPTGVEITACRPRVMRAIRELKPRLILVLGSAGLESLLAHRWFDDSLGGIGRWRGWQAPDQELGAWICPTFHPSYVLRCESGKDPQIPLWFGLDIQAVANTLKWNPAWPIAPKEDQVEIITERAASRLLMELAREGDGPPITIDYETTGLKPNAAGHQIVCVGMTGWPPGMAGVFSMTPRLEPVLAQFLESGRAKIAQNIAFEERWSRVCLGVSVNNWVWDTMLASHALDNRTHISGLKFQAYIQLGITDYSSDIAPFLKAPTSLGFNRILDAPREKLLKYCGMDVLCTAAIEEIQRRIFDFDILSRDGIRLLIEGAQTLADDEENGVVVRRPYIKEQKEHLQRRAAAILRRIESSPEGEIWRKKYGETTNFNSNPQLAAILFGEMGLTCPRTTAKGNPSVNEETLSEMEDQSGLVRDILEARKLDKLAGTYLTGWEREVGADGIMRPFYHLERVRTFRSSSSDPNLQNVPIRDKTAQRVCRRAIYPRAGHHLVEVDYSGAEVRVSACCHKDPTMIKYILDKSTDMHRDMAMECFKLEPDEVSKPVRQVAKGSFVFAEFYGSYWANTGPDLWKHSAELTTTKGLPIHRHLAKHGIRSLEQFLQHTRKVENRFWGERFKVYAKWKDDFWLQYLRQGWFDTLTGFRCSGPMRKNEVVNYPIQGPSFHCLLKAKALTKAWIEENRSGVLPCGQIHDSGLFSVPPEELDEFCRAVHRIWCDDLRALWPWLIVPMEVEIDVTPVDGSWYEKEPYHIKEV